MIEKLNLEAYYKDDYTIFYPCKILSIDDTGGIDIVLYKGCEHKYYDEIWFKDRFVEPTEKNAEILKEVNLINMEIENLKIKAQKLCSDLTYYEYKDLLK